MLSHCKLSVIESSINGWLLRLTHIAAALSYHYIVGCMGSTRGLKLTELEYEWYADYQFWYTYSEMIYSQSKQEWIFLAG